MTSRKPFHYGEFLRAFRAASARHGIDSQQGSTSFQVVHVLAAQRAAASPPDHWWKRHTLWVASFCRSEVEEEAVWNLFLDTYLPVMIAVARAMRRKHAHAALRPFHKFHARKENQS